VYRLEARCSENCRSRRYYYHEHISAKYVKYNIT